MKDNENKLEVHEEFYLTKQNEFNNKNNLYITTPLDKLMNGVLENPEIKTIIDYLKNKLEAFNYEYEEASKGNLMTFSTTNLVIEPGFSNTIEIRLKDKNFKNTIYRDTDKRKLESQLDKLLLLIDDYFN